MTSSNQSDKLAISSIVDVKILDNSSGLENPPRTKVKNLAANAIVLISGGLVAAALSGVAGLLIAHRLGPLEYGRFSIATALVSAFAIAFLFGLDSILTREIARRSQPLAILLSSSLIPSMIWGASLIFIIILVGKLLGYSIEIQKLIMVATVTTAFRAITTLFRSAFRGIEKLEWDAIVQVVSGVLDLVSVWIALALFGTALGASIGLAFGASISLVGVVLIVLKIINHDFHFILKTARSLVADAVPLGFTFLLIGASLRIDMLVLSLFQPESSVGFYASAFGCIMLTRPLSQSSAALLPRIAALDAENDPKLRSVVADGFRYTLIMSCLVATVIIMLSPSIIRFLYGKAFLPAIPSLRVLGLVAGLLFINTYIWNVLISLRKEKVILIAAIAGLISGLGMALVLIPQINLVGGALAAVGRECVQLIILGGCLSRKMPRLLPAKTLSGLAATTIVLVLTLWPLSFREDLGALVWIIPAVGLYTVLLIFTRTIHRNEVDSVGKLLHKWIKNKPGGTK